ncbi:MAG: hypothetical protein ACRDO7_08920 [Nocardioidaceae bacterium]
MSVLKRVALGAAATTLVTTAVAAGGPATASEIKIKAPVTGSTTVKKTDTTLKLPKGSRMTSSLILPGGKLRKGKLEVPQITAHIKAAGIVPIVSKVNLRQTKNIRGQILQKGKNRGHLKATAHNRIAIPFAAVDFPLLDGINIVQDTCTTVPFEIKLLSVDKLNLEKKIKIKTTFTIPKFDKCDIANVPPFDLRDTLLTQLMSGPGNKLNLKIGPIESNANG